MKPRKRPRNLHATPFASWIPPAPTGFRFQPAPSARDDEPQRRGSSINCWSDKYHFDFWRPWTAIRQAGADDNPDTMADPNWAPLLTAPYPDHTSGHMCLDGAHLHTLQLYFGKDNVPISVTSTQFGGETRSFPSFSAPLDEIVEARIWAGLHFRTADVQGRDLGINVANYMADNYFQSVGRR